MPLLVIGEEGQRIIVDTVVDLEVVQIHHTMRARQRGQAGRRRRED